MLRGAFASMVSAFDRVCSGNCFRFEISRSSFVQSQTEPELFPAAMDLDTHSTWRYVECLADLHVRTALGIFHANAETVLAGKLAQPENLPEQDRAVGVQTMFLAVNVIQRE